ncbi:MAG: hypothetical protein Q4G36_07275 [Paracoccus sp. (in: a-proteobacteria)]|nr:hypothetical protein [Paracoccus sp. (in: a-proteobacteria)]
MSRLFILLLTISMGTLAGIGVIIALVAGYVSATGILVGAGGGAVLSLPVTWFAARRIEAAEDVGPDGR